MSSLLIQLVAAVAGAAVTAPPAVHPGNATGTGSQFFIGDASSVDSVNLTNGRVEAKLPLATLAGRNGLDVSLLANYSANGLWAKQPDPRFPDLYGTLKAPPPWARGGWHVQLSTDWRLVQQVWRVTNNFGSTSGYAAPTPAILVRYVVLSPDGSSHELREKGLEDFTLVSPSSYPNLTSALPLPRIFRSVDNTQMELDHTNYAAPVLKLKNGTQVRFSFAFLPGGDDWRATPQSTVTLGLGEATSILDSNGNLLTTTGAVSDGAGGYTETVTDTVGRSIVKAWPANGVYSRDIPRTVVFPGNRTYTFEAAAFDCFASRTQLAIARNPSIAGENPVTIALVKRVTLPNGRGFQFEYRDFTRPADSRPVSDGLMTRVVYPAGGETRYAYAAMDWQLGWDEDLHYARVRTRTVTPGGPSPEGVTTYDPSLSATELTLRVLNAAQDEEIHRFHAGNGPLTGLEYASQVSRAGAVVQTTSRDFEYELASTLYPPLGYNVRLKEEQLTRDGQARRREFVYDHDGFSVVVGGVTYRHTLGNVLTLNEYGGTLLRATVTRYRLWPAQHILNRVSTVEVFDGAGVRESFTAYGYDDYVADGLGRGPLGALPGLPAHDAARGPGYTTRGNLTSTVVYANAAAATGGVWTTRRYDEAGNVVAERDGRGFETQYGYDDASGGHAYRTSVTNPLSQVTRYEWDAESGLLERETDPNLLSTGYTYDALGRLTTKTEPASAASAWVYEDTPGAVAVTLTQGDYTLTTRFDGLGRAFRTEENSDGEGASVVESAYDALGRIEHVSNPGRGAPSAATTVHVYDALGRETELRRPTGGVVRTVYGPGTRRVTDEIGNVTTFATDELDRLVRVSQAGIDTDYSYDARSNLTRASVSGQVREFFFDGLARMVAYSLPEVPASAGSPSYDEHPVTALIDYDASGNVSKRRFAVGPADDSSLATITYTRDALSRPVRVHYAGGSHVPPDEVRVYDTVQLGRLTSTDNGTAQTVIEQYDGEGRPLEVRERVLGMEARVSYAYDALGNLRWLKYPSGREVAVTHSVRRATAVSMGRAVISGVTHWPHGGIRQLTYGNGLRLSQRFNERLQPAEQRLVTPGGAVKLHLAYSFENAAGLNNGSLRTLADVREGSTTTFAYDGRDQLVSASKVGGGAPWSQSFHPDELGNVSVGGAGATALTFDPETNHISSPGFDYDAAGNLVLEPNAEQRSVYDTAGRLVEVQDLAGAVKARFGYDADGQRVVKTDGDGVPLIYFRDLPSGRVLSEYEGTPVAQAPAATVPDELVYSTGDYLSSNRLTTDELQNDVYRSDYLPFGAEVAGSGAVSPQRRFAGKVRVDALQLDDSEARWYAFGAGRFTSVDPLLASGTPERPASWNRYSYALNNPTRYVDPDGREPAGTGFGDNFAQGFIWGLQDDTDQMAQAAVQNRWTFATSLGVFAGAMAAGYATGEFRALAPNSPSKETLIVREMQEIAGRNEDWAHNAVEGTCGAAALVNCVSGITRSFKTQAIVIRMAPDNHAVASLSKGGVTRYLSWGKLYKTLDDVWKAAGYPPGGKVVSRHDDLSDFVRFMQSNKWEFHPAPKR